LETPPASCRGDESLIFILPAVETAPGKGQSRPSPAWQMPRQPPVTAKWAGFAEVIGRDFSRRRHARQALAEMLNTLMFAALDKSAVLCYNSDNECDILRYRNR
jgi:hypothetical protein